MEIDRTKQAAAGPMPGQTRCTVAGRRQYRRNNDCRKEQEATHVTSPETAAAKCSRMLASGGAQWGPKTPGGGQCAPAVVTYLPRTLFIPAGPFLASTDICACGLPGFGERGLEPEMLVGSRAGWAIAAAVGVYRLTAGS